MLNGVLALHDIRDVEAYAASSVARYLRRHNGARLEPCDREDLTAYAIETIWRLSERFDGRPGIEFSGWCGAILPRRLDCWYRDRFVDTRNRHRYTEDEWRHIEGVTFPRSLDEPVGRAGDGVAGVLGDLVAGDESDVHPSVGAVIARLERQRHSERDRLFRLARAWLQEETTQATGRAA